MAADIGVTCLDRLFWAIFLTIAIIETITGPGIFEHSYHPRIYRYNEDVTILQVGESELDFNHSVQTHRERLANLNTGAQVDRVGGKS